MAKTLCLYLMSLLIVIHWLLVLLLKRFFAFHRSICTRLRSQTLKTQWKEQTSSYLSYHISSLRGSVKIFKAVLRKMLWQSPWSRYMERLFGSWPHTKPPQCNLKCWLNLMGSVRTNNKKSFLSLPASFFTAHLDIYTKILSYAILKLFVFLGIPWSWKKNCENTLRFFRSLLHIFLIYFKTKICHLLF